MEDLASIIDGSNAATNRQWNENFARCAPYNIDHGVALIGRSGDIEEYQLVRALFVIARGEFHGVAGIAQIDEVHTFHYAAGGHVETRNDAFGKHVTNPRNSSRLSTPALPISPDGTAHRSRCLSRAR